MPIFLERFVLTVLSGVVVSLVLLNVFKLDMRRRISLLVITVAAAYLVAHTLTLKGASITQGDIAYAPTVGMRTNEIGKAINARDRARDRLSKVLRGR
jgi:hypothetical protein